MTDTSEVDSLLSGAFTAADLQVMTFEPLREFVPSLITEGFGILAGGPKMGKSYMGLDIVNACGSGGFALGNVPAEECDVLYLALEDSQRRLQSRMRQILTPGRTWPSRLVLKTSILPGMVAATLTEWYEAHPKSLVVLDTLTKNRPQRPPGADPYIADYRFGSALKDVVDASPGSALLAIHHTRKMAAEDFLDTLSGTQGIAGAADYVLVLRRKRKSSDASLSVTGRDILEDEYALVVEDGRWRIDGATFAEAAAKAQQRKDEPSNLGDRSLEAVKFVSARASTTPKDLAEHLGIDNKIAGNLLGNLSDGGYVTKASRGTYLPIGGESGETGEKPAQAPPALSLLSPDSPPPNADGALA